MGASNSHHVPHPEGETMKALVFTQYGKPDATLELHDNVPKPVAGAGEILIKVHAASVNPIDKIRVTGGLKALRPERAWPAVLGYDAAGVVEVCGEGTSMFNVGDEVFVRVSRNDSMGSIAEFLSAPESQVALKPSNASFEEAASLPLVSLTALQALRRAGVTEGSNVLVTGGAGGVGSIGIQLAKNVMKAGSVATTASPGIKTTFVTSLGADIVVDYRSEKIVDKLKDIDCTLDTTAESANAVLVTNKGGKVVTISGTPTVDEITRISGAPPNFIVRSFLRLGRQSDAINAAAKGDVEWSYLFMQPIGKDLKELAGYVEAEQVKPQLDGVWDLADWKGAIDKSFSGRAKGKCVIKIV